MWFQRVGFDFSRAISLIFLLLYEHVHIIRVYESWIIFLFFGFVQPRNKHVVQYDTQRSFCRFSGTTQTDCRSCSVDPKMHHPAKRSLAMCQHTGQVLRDFIVVMNRDICREHSLIGRRNCLMTEAANSLSAAAGPEIIDN